MNLELLMFLAPWLFNVLGEQETEQVYTDPQDVPLTPEDLASIGELAGPSLFGDQSLTNIMQAAPEDFRPFISAGLEQQAARNAISQQNYANWITMMNQGYGKAADTLGAFAPAII